MTTAAPSTSRARLLLWQLALTAVALWLPIIVGRIVLGAPAMTMLLFGTLSGLISTIAGGRRVGSAAAITFVLAAPIALVAGQDPIAGTCVIALACLLIGGASYYKRYSGFSIILVGLLFTVTLPATVAGSLEGGLTQNEYLLRIVMGTAVCGFWPVIIVPLMHGVRSIPRTATYEIPDVARYAVALAVLVGATTFYALVWGQQNHGVWLPLTLIMVMQVQPGSAPHRTAQRITGTVAGAIVAAVLATFFHQAWEIGAIFALTTIGLLLTVGREPYGRFVFFLTILILTGVSAGEPALEASLQRIWFTLLGCGIAIAVYLAKVVYLHHATAARKRPIPAQVNEGRPANAGQ